MLGRELGGGGMSRVFVARDEALGRDVVVKVLAPELASELSAERFAREIRVAASLQQANIVPVLQAGVAGETPYYTMPFVEGESLRKRLRGGPAFGVSEALGLLRDVARALSYAHERGVVHCDIKPENILLSHGAATVIDFGIAKAISTSRTAGEARRTADDDATTLTRAGISLGTPAYMAPEQTTGVDVIDQRADLYAWGCVAYELFSGAPPFVRDGTAQVLAAHLTEAPKPLDPSRVPAPIARIILQCLAKDPAARPASAGALLEALEPGAITGSAAAPAPRAASARGWLAAAMIGLVVAIGWWARVRSATTAPVASAATPSTETAASLAVIPFSSVGGDTANTYLAEGIADELTTVLARTPGLRLAGRNSAARFRGGDRTAQEIGKALDVRTVLVGSVRKAGGRVRVTAELASASDGSVVWQDTFEREASDVFAVQEALANAIAGALRVRLTPATSGGFGTTNVAAYDEYLRGAQLLRRRGVSLAEALSHFDQAIALDSSFARAYAAKSLALITSPYYTLTPFAQVLPEAQRTSERALSLAPQLAEAHIARAVVHLERFEWNAAFAEAERAVALDSTSVESWYQLGFIAHCNGRLDDADRYLTRARALDPLWSTGAVYLGHTRVLLGRTADGLALVQRALELDSTLASVRSIGMAAMIDAGQRDAAAELAAASVPMFREPRRLGVAAYALLHAGRTREGSALIAQLERMPPSTWGRAYALGVALLATDTARALGFLEQSAARGGEGMIASSLASVRYDEVRTSPHFREIMRTFHLENSVFVQPGGGRRPPR